MPHLDTELAHLLIHGKLAPADAAAWEKHLARCEACHRIVAEERSWSSLLKVEQSLAASEPSGISSARLLPRLQSLVPDPTRRQQRRRVLMLLGCTLAVATAATVVAWRSALPSPAQRLARETGLTETLQSQIIPQLDALLVLRRDPWLMEEQRTVEMFERLLQSAAETSP